MSPSILRVLVSHLPLATFGLALATAGCGHGQLLPDRKAEKVKGTEAAAFSTENGVRVSVNPEGWHGDPEDLGKRFTPVKVRVVNNSGKPVMIMYQAFAFEDADQQTYYPLPVVPLDIVNKHPGTIDPLYSATNFFVAKRYETVYPGLTPGPRNCPAIRTCTGNQYAEWRKQAPTREMRRMGLPKGVLANGGSVAGYLSARSDRQRRKADLPREAGRRRRG